MHAVVTGGAGFIGSHLVDALIRDGTVAVLDDLSSGGRERLDPSVELHETDVRDAGAICRIVTGLEPDTIFHLAAQADVRRSVADPGGDAAINVLGTIAVLSAARTVSARVVFASSGGALYGESDAPARESDQSRPLSPYGTSKLCGEHYCGLFRQLYEVPVAVLRLANVYGPRQDSRGEAGVVSRFAAALHRKEALTVFGDGLQTRDYVYVADVVRALRLAANTPRSGTWNVATGRSTSVIELLAALERVSGRPVARSFAAPRPGELQHSSLSPTAAAVELGFTADVALDTGVRRVLDWVAAGEPGRAPA